MTSLSRNLFLMGISNIRVPSHPSLPYILKSYRQPKSNPSITSVPLSFFLSKSMFNSSQSLSLPSFDPLSHPFRSILSYNGSVMLAGLISLLLVTIFVVLLHIYAKWFLAQARHQRGNSITVTQVLGQPRLHHFHSISFDHSSSPTGSPTKGLDASVISSIPLFIYVSENQCKRGLECVICLSTFEENEIGRSLPKCNHVFHVECIDMWLSSHSNCPICRAPVVRDENSRNGIVGNHLELSENEVQIVIGGQQC